MAEKQIIDVHCHLFNAQYAVMELAAATWNHLRGNYPHQEGEAPQRAARGMIETLDGVQEFAAWIARLMDVALSGCEGNFDTARNCFAQSTLGKNASLAAAPLMMDIYFALDDNQNEEENGRRLRKAAPTAHAFAIPDDQKKNFDAHFEKIRKLIAEKIPERPKKGKRLSYKRALDAAFAEAREELLLAPHRTGRGGDPYAGIELSPGYKKHMHDLEALAKKYPGQVFPFLAVDPRRIGILELVKMKVNQGKGIFKGIKIYPPLGYLPTHPNLEPIFDYCSRYDIPIILHCSPGGMQNFRSRNYVSSWTGNSHWEDFQSVDRNKSRFYTAPEKWLPVLDRWPDLRINFAHFGGGERLDKGDRAWMNDIIKLIRKHPHVYTDFSYHARPKLPEKIMEVVSENECLNKKLMFGTDYIMILMDRKLGGLSKYFDLYQPFKSNLLCNNARDFLKL
ncbi:MAG: amidohydrolase family protein [Deltaproteobacteria bacterium]